MARRHPLAVDEIRAAVYTQAEIIDGGEVVIIAIRLEGCKDNIMSMVHADDLQNIREDIEEHRKQPPGDMRP